MGSIDEAGMATVTLKNVPEELVRSLKEAATQNRRSLNAEALARLESTLARRRTGLVTVKALQRLHKRLNGVAPLTEALLNRAKSDRRS
jgi:GTP1/Obg family GTP-binding protein